MCTNESPHSEDVPVAGAQVRGHDLVSLASDVGTRVPVEDLQALDHLLLIARRRAVTHVVEDLSADVLVVVLGQLEKPVPEVRLVALDSAWAHLLGGLQPDLRVVVLGELNDLLNVRSSLDLLKRV